MTPTICTRHGVCRLALFALVCLYPIGARAWAPWDPTASDPAASRDSAWSKTLELLWNSTRERVGFCLGRSQRGALELAALSFQWPLPTGPSGDALCSNRSEIELRLCSLEEVKEYYKYMLPTTNSEKVPDTPQCRAGAYSAACSPGFFDANLANRVEPVSEPKPHACCEGYFCPSALTCMMPCPLGAYCPRAWPAPPPDGYRSRGEASMWCAPYAYKERRPEGCGGADRWSVIPEGAFPGARWGAGQGSIFCDGGSFCPNSTAKLPCPLGHYCRQGSVEPDRCPLGVHCPPGTAVLENGTTGITVDALLFAGLWLLWQCSRWYNKVLRRLGTKERLRITWGRQPAITVVAAAPEAPRPPTPPRLGLENGPAGSEHDGSSGKGAEGRDAAGGSGSDGELERAEEASTTGSQRSLLWALSPGRRRRARPAKAAAGPVWASFRGPEDDDYEALPDHPELGSELAPITSPHREDGMRSGLSHHRRSSSDGVEDSSTPTSLHRRLLSRQQRSQSLLDPGSLAWASGAAQAGAALGGGRRRPVLAVQFRELGLRLRSCGKVVLQGVAGQLRGARTTAIMGPSGAGKTSLLNVLSGKAASYGVQTGEILVNGRPDALDRYKAISGFVPQDDIMHSTLSVEENLMFAARYRLPAHYAREQHLYFVERAIQTLQLEDVRHELIGNEDTRGISGGQRKRVNVGLELVADPSLLLLDEPTSGLDSTASKALVAALQAVAHGGVTAAAVIHQPSYECFEMFDDLLLLGKGGRTVYYGPQAGVQAYFEGLGYELPPRMNPADVYMDIIFGTIAHPTQPQVDASHLFAAWDEHCGRIKPQQALAISSSNGGEGRAAEAGEGGEGEGEKWVQLASTRLGAWRARAKEAVLVGAAYMVSCARELWEGGVELCRSADATFLGGRVMGGSGKQLEGDAAEGDARDVRRLAQRRTPGFVQQFWWCLSRAILKRVREPLMVFTDYSIVALTGFTLGLISDRGRSTIMHFSVSVTYSIIALGMISKVGALPTFSRDRAVFFREAGSGLNRLSFFCALDSFGNAGILLRSAVYLIMWYSFASPRAVIWQLFLITLGVMYCCSGIAYLLTQVMEPSAAQLSAAVLTLISTLIARESNPHGLLLFIKETSFARFGLEGMVIAESNRLTGVWLLARCADLEGLGYDVRRFGFCLLALFGLGVLYRAAAVLCMLLLNRDKQR